jgi:HPt (histidine-containing phosphotransfer) domain-containing protein
MTEGALDGDRPILDSGVLAGLRESVGGDGAFVADLVTTYLGDAATQLADIERAVEAGDANGLVRPAHTLKSASLTVGAIRLGERSRTLEQQARSGDVSGSPTELAAAREEWAATEQALQNWLDEQAAEG